MRLSLLGPPLQATRRQIRTPKIDSGGPDGSLGTTRELGSLSETYFSFIFVRSVKDSRIFANSTLRNWLVGSVFLINRFLIQAMGCIEGLNAAFGDLTIASYTPRA